MFRKVSKFAIIFSLLFAFIMLPAAETRAKYVFLFVGDGMGENIRKYYQHEFPDSSLEKFPVTVRSGTNNVSNGKTDSAASGTAIACGIKTYNGAIGVTDKHVPVTSLAKILRDEQFSIGIITSVGINDATPSAHYANRLTRRDYAGILSDLFASNFDFFAGGFMLKPQDYTIERYEKLLNQVKYQFCDNYNFNEKTPKKRVLFVAPMTPDWPGKKEPRHILSEVTNYAIQSLAENPKGFFMLIEGGAIDHRAHNNDLAGVMREMREFDLAVKTALEFQKKHPAETLIVITSDHDTGGMDIKEFKDNSLWKKQLLRAADAGKKFASELKNASESELIKVLAEYFGMENLTADEIRSMSEAIKTFRDPKLRNLKQFRSMYGSYNPVIVQMMRLRDARCGVSWKTFSHTDRKVLTNAQGPGEKYFQNVKENSDIPRAISCAVLGYDALQKNAGKLPYPVEKNAEEYFNFISLNDHQAIFRYGQNDHSELELILQGGGRVSGITLSDRAGRIEFRDLAADTDYTMQVKRGGRVIAGRKIRTLKKPAGKPLLTAGVIADAHVALIPDVRFGRLHSKSLEALENACKSFVGQKVDFIALPGDVTDASKMYELNAVGKVLDKFKTMKFYATAGNHDLVDRREFKKRWVKLFGETARVEKHGKLQILLLDTFNGSLADKKANFEAVKSLDPALPVLVFTHYQLTPDAFLKDKKRAINDSDKAAEILKKLSVMKGAIIVGHKNIATSAKLGNLVQINAPQLTQFPAGVLRLEIFSNGMRLEFQPVLDVFYDEYSRIRGIALKQTAAERDKNSLNIWNAFYPADFSAAAR